MQSSTRDLCWELYIAFCLTQLSTQVPSLTSKKVCLPCRHLCHTWNLGLGTPCEMVTPNFLALNGWDCTKWPQLTCGWEFGTPCGLTLIVDRPCSVLDTTCRANIHCRSFLKHMGSLVLQCCEIRHLESDLKPNLNHPWLYFITSM